MHKHAQIAHLTLKTTRIFLIVWMNECLLILFLPYMSMRLVNRDREEIKEWKQSVCCPVGFLVCYYSLLWCRHVLSLTLPHTHTLMHAQTHAHTLPDPSLIHWLTFDPQCCSVDQTYPNPTETTIQHCGATTHTILHYVGERQRRWGRTRLRERTERNFEIWRASHSNEELKNIKSDVCGIGWALVLGRSLLSESLNLCTLLVQTPAVQPNSV